MQWLNENVSKTIESIEWMHEKKCMNERQCFLNFVHTFLNTCLRSKVFSLKAIILRFSLAVAAFQGLRFSWGPLKYKLGNPYCGNKMRCLWPSAQLVEIWTTYVLVIVPQLQYLLPRINNALDQPTDPNGNSIRCPSNNLP